MRIAVAAIAKDEIDYLPEWTAWHLLQGFDHFLLADHGSTDGTTEYFEALCQLGICDLNYVSKSGPVQAFAYNELLKCFGDVADAVAFVDLDEFITCGNSLRAKDHLAALFTRGDYGAVSMNWRVFGSNGHRGRVPGLLAQRFTKAASDDRFINHHIKTVVRPNAVRTMHVHHAELHPNFRYCAADGGPMTFLENSRGGGPTDRASPFSDKLSDTLRVNHYIVKSFKEFLDNKVRRGMIDQTGFPAAEKYFQRHDLNDIEFNLSAGKAAELINTMNSLENRLRAESHHYTRVSGRVEKITQTFVGGWCAAVDNPTICLRVKVFVNGKLRTIQPAYRYRHDVVSSGRSSSVRTGFHITFDELLNVGDEVTVRVYANSTKLGNATSTVTE